MLRSAHHPQILITGFEPFGGSAVNPSAVVIESLRSLEIAGAQIETLLLPVVGGTGPGSARAALDETFQRLTPDAVVHLGEAHLRSEVSVERIAINLRDYSMRDNSGGLIRNQPVKVGAAAAHFSTLPIETIVNRLCAEQIPAGISLSAGAFLCNEVMFHTLEYVHATRLRFMAGFIHLPQLHEQHKERPVAARPISRLELTRTTEILIESVTEAVIETAVRESQRHNQ